MKKYQVIFILFFIAFCTIQCGNATTDAPPIELQPDTPVETKKSATVLNDNTFEVTKNGQTLGTISGLGERMEIATNGLNITTRLSKGKRKYEAKGRFIAEVKYKDDGFKVRNQNGQLLWKIKYKSDKIKVSDNEENLQPYELKIKSTDRAKVVRNDQELGQVRFRAAENKIEITSTTANYDVKTTSYDSAFGVLLMGEIPISYRWIIIAELLNKPNTAQW